MPAAITLPDYLPQWHLMISGYCVCIARYIYTYVNLSGYTATQDDKLKSCNGNVHLERNQHY